MKTNNLLTIQGSESLNKMKLLMNYDNKKTLNENKENIFDKLSSDFVFTDLVSPDNKYILFFDQLIEVETKKHLGCVWDSIDNVRLFFESTFVNATKVPKQIRETHLNGWKKILLKESYSKYDLNVLKEAVRYIVMEERSWGQWLYDTAKGAVNYGVDKAKELAKNTANIIGGAVTGTIEVGKALASGDLLKVLDLIKKGGFAFARYLRSFMYNPIGIAIDSVLLALGVGKTVQWIPWAIIVALDIYELISGDYEEKDVPMWLRIIMIGFDILGLVVGAVAAKSAKLAANPLMALKGKSAVEIGEVLSKNPALLQQIKNMEQSVAKVPGFLQKAVDWIKPKFPKMGQWLEKMASSASGFVKKVTESLSKILTWKTGKDVATKAAKTSAEFYGFEKGIEYGSHLLSGKAGKTADVAGGGMAQLDQAQMDAINAAMA